MDQIITKMTKKEFESLPVRKWGEEISLCDSLVILPTNHKHDSGYMTMDFVACNENRPICRLSGCSDVLHIDGIGGYGEREEGKFFPDMIKPRAWSIDCLPKSKLLRLFSAHGKIRCGLALSSFEIYSVDGAK
jgi:hypothetical protein